MNSNKKIGIVTYHCVDNFGAVLQAFALQKILNKLSKLENEIIDYKPYFNYKGYSIINNPFVKNKSILLRFKILMSNFDISQKIANIYRKKNFDKFRNRFLKLSSYSLNNDKDLTYIDNYSVLITGSDQVFNTSIQKDNIDRIYFLDIETKEIKKISYAASLGKLPVKKEFEKLVAEKIGNLDFISIREKSGIEYLKKLIKNDISLCLDPTLLLNMDEWENISENISESEYILVYDLEFNMNVVNIVNKISDQLNKKVICFSTRGKKYYTRYYKNFNSEGPLKFLTLIRCADFIVTNSFHGTVFSIIFRKQFVSIKNELRPERAVDLLRTLNLNTRMIQFHDDINSEYFNRVIDYREPNDLLENEKLKSIQFLKDSIGDHNEN